MTLQRHIGAPPLKPVPDVPLVPGAKKIVPDAKKKSEKIEERPLAGAPCQVKARQVKVRQVKVRQAEDASRD
jgi:hypothetical protein